MHGKISLPFDKGFVTLDKAYLSEFSTNCNSYGGTQTEMVIVSNSQPVYEPGCLADRDLLVKELSVEELSVQQLLDLIMKKLAKPN